MTPAWFEDYYMKMMLLHLQMRIDSLRARIELLERGNGA